jgi:peptide N-acetyl-beta-D-glucosaminyl asparaginase amidase A
MSHYISLWKQPQKLIFDLGNLVDDTYTGVFNAVLNATFWMDNNKTQPAADLIIPVSKRQSNQGQPSAYRVPDDGTAKNSFVIPRNAKKAVFTISACGQAAEEFWWSNVPNSVVNTFKNNSLPGLSPWRELQLWVDGTMTGVTWPFPIIFTGGVIPTFWRPLVGIDTFDLKEDEIDLTPWLPVLSDGKEHSYEIKVAGLGNDGSSLSAVASNWVVTGKLFLWLDAKGSVTTGAQPKISMSSPKFTVEQAVTQDTGGKNDTLTYKVTASREVLVDGSITTSAGTVPAGWKQSLKFSNVGKVTAGGFNQTNTQTTSGTEVSGNGYARNFKYPLDCRSDTVYNDKTKEMYIGGTFKRNKLVQSYGVPVFPTGLDEFDSKGEPPALGFLLNTTQQGEAWFHQVPAKNQSDGSGITEQGLNFYRLFGNLAKYPEVGTENGTEVLYGRHILYKDSRLVNDEEIELAELDPVGEPPIRAVDASKPELLTVEDLKRAGGHRLQQLLGP